MHSRIFEVRYKNFPVSDWANGTKISNENYEVEGADYFDELDDKDERAGDIEDFFTKYFPFNAFEVVENEPGQTAVVKFTGDIDEIYAQWYEHVKDAFSGLNKSMGTMDMFRVKMALDEPFDLDYKFYLCDWLGYTGTASDFMEWLKYLSRENEGNPFKLYVGQVFDYHY